MNCLDPFIFFGAARGGYVPGGESYRIFESKICSRQVYASIMDRPNSYFVHSP